MMSSPKPLASLSSGLLARKGGARPAMRSQAFATVAPSSVQHDDLGWNDMGAAPVESPAELAVPQVLVEREALKDGIESLPAETPVEAPVAARPVSVATATRLRRESRAQTARGKAAFTLRIDAERHLRLRLASAVANRSAQILVTQALDAFLSNLPEVDALVAQLPPAGKR